MTSTQIPPRFPLPSTDLSPAPPQESAPEDPIFLNSSKPIDSLNETVSSFVDGLVDAAISKATIHAEKRNVQALINKLVSQVREDASNAQRDNSRPQHRSAPSESSKLPRGVPLGDHRQRKCLKLPVTWTQTMDSITLNVGVPSSVRKQQVSVRFTAGSVKASFKGNPTSPETILFDEPLVAEIAVDGCMWALEEEGSFRKLIIELEKARMQWWARLFMSDDPDEYAIVSSESLPASTDNCDHNASLPSKGVSAKDWKTSSARLLATKQAKEAGAASEEPADSKLENGVATFVDEVVEAVSSGHTDASKEARSSIATAGSANGHAKLSHKRVLTRADIPKMVEQCKKIVESGGTGASESALQLATFYHHGLGVEQNDMEAARLYKYALENGILDPSAAFQLGLIYNQGAPGLPPNAKEAVRWWRVSASLRNPVAMFNLGVMHMNGSGCDMDPIMATRWFQQAQALDPRLQPPQFSRAQLEERITAAMKLKKQRLKRALPPEEKQRRKEIALQKVRTLAYGSAALVGLSISVVALRYWLRNRL